MKNFGCLMDNSMNDFLHYNPQPIIMPTRFLTANTYQSMLGLLSELQSTVINQESIIQSLTQKVQLFYNDPYDSLLTASQDNNKEVIKTELKSPTRKNGFKPKQQTILCIAKYETDDESVNKKILYTKRTRTKQTSVNSSKAKHLWVNYGRRILEFAVHQTTDRFQEKVQQLFGKLNTKKDYVRTFEFQESDTEDDRAFKSTLGRLAIYFVRNKALETFENSKHKEEMISQRHIVAAWIETLMET